MVSVGERSAVEVEPGEPPRSTVIWLHGLGADGHDFEPLVPHLGVERRHAVRFVFPHAPLRPVTVNMGLIMRAWYDIREMSLSRDVDERGVHESAALVAAQIESESRHGIAPRRVVLAGFSQGGAIALHVGLRYPQRLAGIVALSTYLVCGENLAAERSEANRHTPVFQAHGTHDPMVPIAAGLLARDQLRALGYAVDWHTYPMGHEVHPLEVRDIGTALNVMLADADPLAASV